MGLFKLFKKDKKKNEQASSAEPVTPEIKKEEPIAQPPETVAETPKSLPQRSRPPQNPPQKRLPSRHLPELQFRRSRPPRLQLQQRKRLPRPKQLPPSLPFPKRPQQSVHRLPPSVRSVVPSS